MFCFPSSTPSTSCTRHRSPQSLGAHDAVPGRRCLAELAVHSVHHSRKQSVVASAQGPQNGDGHSSPPPDMAGLFREAQSNIMRLNQSRLKALEELKTARSRITELGEAAVPKTRHPAFETAFRRTAGLTSDPLVSQRQGWRKQQRNQTRSRQLLRWQSASQAAATRFRQLTGF